MPALFDQLVWTPARVGCHWTRGAYTISTESGGGQPSGYVLYRDRQQIGGRYPSFDAAATASIGHELQSTDTRRI